MAWVADACTLPTAERPLRLAEFDALFAAAVRPAERVSPMVLRIHLPGGEVTAAGAEELAARESACCSFFTFTVSAADGRTELEVRVPASRAAVLDAVQQRADAVRAGGGRP